LANVANVDFNPAKEAKPLLQGIKNRGRQFFMEGGWE